jgi:tetratricopeptide (TPR) repeat protein
MLAILLATPAQAEWWEAKTEHFVIYSEDDQKDTRAFATELERFDHALRSLQNTKFDPIQSDSLRVTIYRVGDIDYMSRLAHASAAGFYRPQLYPVAFTPVRGERINTGSIIRRDSRTNLDPKSVLFHEYGHHFMFQYFPAGYPSWYTEAFAETVATIDLKPDRTFHLGNPPQYRSDALFNSLMTVTPQSLLASTAKPDGEDYYGFYTVGWLMNHYLTFEPKRKGQLQTYLRLVNGGMDSGPAARQAFGDLNRLGAEIGRYKTSGKLGGAIVRPATKANPQVAMRRLAPDEEAVMRLKVRTKAGVTRSEARGIAAESRELARTYPNSLAVHLQLAEAEFDAKNLDAASAAADRAISLNPNSVEALMAKAQILLKRGKKDKKYLPEARAFAAKAHKIDPIDPAPLVTNYLTFFESGQPVPESAVIGLETAFQRGRQDLGLRVILGRQLLAEKKGKLAREILLPLGLNPHESKDKKKMREIIELIDASKVDEAYSKLAAEMRKWEEEAEKGLGLLADLESFLGDQLRA